MKKLNLNVANLGATEVLSREELKKVLGGITTAAGSGSYTSGCAGLSKDSCNVSCTDSDGHSGSCGWVYATQNKCMCATVYVP